MRNAIAGVVGLAIGLGLCLSGMNEPSKVLAFWIWRATGIPRSLS